MTEEGGILNSLSKLTNAEKKAAVEGRHWEFKNKNGRDPGASELALVSGVSYPTVVKYCRAAGLSLKVRVVGRKKEATDG